MESYHKRMHLLAVQQQCIMGGKEESAPTPDVSYASKLADGAGCRRYGIQLSVALSTVFYLECENFTITHRVIDKIIMKSFFH